MCIMYITSETMEMSAKLIKSEKFPCDDLNFYEVEDRHVKVLAHSTFSSSP